MKVARTRRSGVALVARASTSRTEVARYLRDVGFEVHECEELATVGRFVGIVLVDDPGGEAAARAQVEAWLARSKPPRVVVISSKPARWKPLASSLGDPLIVLAAPAFGWEIVDALRMGPGS